MFRTGTLVLSCALLHSAVASAAVIDFENAASFGGDNAVASASYFDTFGLSVAATAGGTATSSTTALLTFERYGRDFSDAFSAGRGRRDVADAGNLGNYFLKAGRWGFEYSRSRFFNMSIDFHAATKAASGEIWDIDGQEQYQVIAYDTAGAAVATLTSPVGGLNAQPWTWSFDTGTENVAISSIDISFASDRSTLRGFAFDNFDTTAANPAAAAQATPLEMLLASQQAQGTPGSGTGNGGSTHSAPLPSGVLMVLVGLLGMRFFGHRTRAS